MNVRLYKFLKYGILESIKRKRFLKNKALSNIRRLNDEQRIIQKFI